MVDQGILYAEFIVTKLLKLLMLPNYSGWHNEAEWVWSLHCSFASATVRASLSDSHWESGGGLNE